MRKAFYAISLLLAVALGFLLGRTHTQVKPSATTARRVLYYVDPMHPAYRSEKPGIAPDCGMQLEPVYSDEAGKAIVAATAHTLPETVSIDSYTQQLFGIRLTPVQKTSGTRTWRMPGRVTEDETRVYRVNASLEGFVRETHEDTVGSPVKKGQRLAVVYSHEFFSVIGGYVSASEQAQSSTDKGDSAETRNLLGVKTWADRLSNLGMSEAQIEELYVTRKIPEGVYIVSPADGFIVARNISPGLRFDRNMEFYRIADLSHVWIVADLFGGEDQHFQPGVAARITLRNQNKSFSARVSDILPQVDPVTRAIKLRLDCDNKKFVLRPDMLVDVDFPLPTPPGLSVPADAVVDSGASQLVYVDRGNGMFEPRQVETGERFGDRVQILRGLAEDEKVVASGTFLVDSETRLKSPPQSAPQTGPTHTSKRGSEMAEVR